MLDLHFASLRDAARPGEAGAFREGAAEVNLDGDACPACGCTLPLTEGACADCGLQLE
jgi:hypothetical protein